MYCRYIKEQLHEVHILRNIRDSLSFKSEVAQNPHGHDVTLTLDDLRPGQFFKLHHVPYLDDESGVMAIFQVIFRGK